MNITGGDVGRPDHTQCPYGPLGFQALGRRGGRSRSPIKIRASRVNGAKGGRPRAGMTAEESRDERLYERYLLARAKK